MVCAGQWEKQGQVPRSWFNSFTCIVDADVPNHFTVSGHVL